MAPLQAETRILARGYPELSCPRAYLLRHLFIYGKVLEELGRHTHWHAAYSLPVLATVVRDCCS